MNTILPVVSKPNRRRRKPNREAASDKVITTRTIERMVERALDKRIEDKYFCNGLIYQTTATTSVTPPATALELSTAGLVTQGSDSGNRIGDAIRVKRANLNVAIIQNGGSVVIGPTMLSLYVARVRATPVTSPSTSNYQVLKQSFQTPGAFTMEQSDQPNTFYCLPNGMMCEIAHHSSHLIGLAQPTVASGLNTNNDSKQYDSVNIDLTNRYPGITRFNGNAQTNNVWFLFAFAYEITSSPTVSAVYPLIRGAFNLVYEDA
jgi:hypothetical protein